MGVVVRRHANHLVAHARSASRIDAIRAAVTDRCDYDDSGIYEIVARDGRRRSRPVVKCVTDAHIEHVHAVVGNALHRGNHHIVGHRAGAPEDAVGAERYTRRNAAGVGGVVRAAGANDAGYVRAMPVAIVWVRVWLRDRLIRRRRAIRVVAIAHEIPTGDDTGCRKYLAVAARHPIAAEVGMVVVDARVHNGHLHPRAG